MPPGDAEIRWNLGGYHGAHMLQTRLTEGKKKTEKSVISNGNSAIFFWFMIV